MLDSPGVAKHEVRRGDTCLSYALFALVLGGYGYCLSSSPASWDNAELQTVPYVLGIAHPTGFPLFVLIGWVFSHAIAFGTVAWRMNLLSATCVAVASLGVFRCARICDANAYGSLVAAALFCSGPVVLGKGMHTDVHAMSTMWFALMLWNALAYVRDRAPNALYRACLFSGLGIATHPTALWWLPAIALAVAYRAPAVTILLRAAALVALPLATYAYLPLRSAFVKDPNAALGLGYAYAAVWNTNDPQTLLGFVRELSGSDYGVATVLFEIFDVKRYCEFAAYWSGGAMMEFGIVALGLAALGGAILLWRRPKVFGVLVLAGFGSVPFAVAYAGVEGDVVRYLMPSFVICAIATAAAPSLLAGLVPKKGRAMFALLYGAQLAALIVLVRANWQAAVNERHDSGGTNAVESIRRDTPQNAIVIAPWVDGTSLAYAKYVERSLGARYVVIAWPADLESSLRRLATIAPVYVFVPSDRAAGFTGATPERWRTALKSSASDHALFRVCASRSACES